MDFLNKPKSDQEFEIHKLELNENENFKQECFYLSEILKSETPDLIKKSILNNYNVKYSNKSERMEHVFLSDLIRIVNAGEKEHDFKLQYSILKYKVDCFFETEDMFFTKYCTIIEFDENHHEKPSNIVKDENRIKEIKNELFLQKYTSLRLIRVRAKYSNECLKHLIPYLSRFDVYCLDIAIEKGYLKVFDFENEKDI